MTRTSIIPSSDGCYIPIPPQYIGKEIEVLVYQKSEITEMTEQVKNIASYRGILSDSEGAKMQEYILKAREEWAQAI